MNDSFHDDLAAPYRADPAGAGLQVRPSAGSTRVTVSNGVWNDGAPVPAAEVPHTGGSQFRTGGMQSWSAATGEASTTSGAESWRPEAVDPGRVGVAGTLSKLYGTDGGGRVTIPGFGVTNADTAVKMGFCRWDGDRLVDVGSPSEQAQNTQSQEPQEQPAAADPGQAVYPPHEDAALAVSIEPLSQSGYDRAVGSAIGALVHRGGDFTLTARNLAEMESAQGNPMRPEEAHELVLDVMAMHERAAARAAATVLGDDQARHHEFRQWLAGNTSRFEACLSDLVYRRDPQKLIQAAADFRRHSPGDLTAYTAAGFETSVDTKGRLMLRNPKLLGGRWVDAADLAKL